MNPTDKGYDEGYSPDIVMTLFLGGEQFDVWTVGPSEMTLHDPRPMRPGKGSLQIRIADSVSIYPMELTEGIDPARREQPCRRLDSTADAAA